MPNRNDRAPGFNPYRRFALLALLAALSITFGLLLSFPRWDVVFTWLIAINVVMFAALGYDKAAAPTGAARVPEAILLALTALGGGVGAVIGRLLFRHKTRKASFQPAFWLCVILSTVLAVVYYVVICPECR